jgi:hypothetical protein
MRNTKTLLLCLTSMTLGGVAVADDVTPTDLLFKFDSSALPANAHVELTRVADRARSHDELIVLDGNADQTGNAPYNVRLSLRRSEAVRASLISLGVDPGKIIIAGYGEDSARRNSFADDRRVTIWTTRKSVASVIAQTFAGHGTAILWDKPLSVAQLDASSAAIVARRR